MKTKLFIGLVLVLLGTDLFTYATSRYMTTKYVLTRARERMEAALKKEELYEQVYRTDQPRIGPISLAISQAGGMYYWWNDGLVFWGAAVLLTATGILVPFVQPRRMNAA